MGIVDRRRGTVGTRVGIDVLVFVVDGWLAGVGNCGAELELGS